MAEWSLDLTKYADRQISSMKGIRKSFVFRLYSAIVRRTPVDTGRARGNWNVSVGAADAGENPQNYSEAGSMPDADGDEPYFISNNTEYIRKLEYGGYTDRPETEKTRGGFSKQAPHGMVGVTLANAGSYFQQAVREYEE